MPRLHISDFDAAQFRALRVRSGMSITELATKAKLSRGAVSKWENGRSKPSPENFIKVMQALNVNPEIIVPDKGNVATLFDLRAQAGLTRTQVERALNISRSAWGDIERGTARLGNKRVSILAATLNVPEERVRQAAKNTQKF